MSVSEVARRLERTETRCKHSYKKMRYVYQSVAQPAAVAAVRTEVTSASEDGVEIFVSAAEYDALLAVLAAGGAGVVADDITDVFKHRGPITIVCDSAG